MTELVIIAKISAIAGQEKHVSTQVEHLASATREETGCIRYEVYRDPSNDAVTLIYEVWVSFSVWRAHIATEHLQAFKREVLTSNIKATMSVEKLRFDPERS